MTPRNMMTASTLLTLTAAVFPPAVAFAHSPAAGIPRSAPLDNAARALELRNTTGALWKAGRYAEAAEALREALAIYDAELAAGDVDGGFIEERGATLRALVWNEYRAGESDEALVHFERLVDLAAEHASVMHERDSAYSAALEHIGKLGGARAVGRAWRGIQEIFEGVDDQQALGQVAHDLAGQLSEVGDEKGARRSWLEAAAIRRAVGDHDGLSWTLNNMGYASLQSGDWEDALEHFTAGLAEIRSGRATAAQSALGYNVLHLGAKLLNGPRPDRNVVASLWKIAEAEASSQLPTIVAPERLLAIAFRAEAARVGAKRAGGAAERLVRAMPQAPAPVTADLVLRAADVLVEGGAPAGVVRSILDSARIDGLAAAPHLKVRKSVLDSRIAAEESSESGFDAAAREALELLDELGHDATIRQGLDTLAAAASAFPRSAVAQEVVRLRDERMRRGKPGGAGGSSLSGAGGPRPAALADLAVGAPIFEIWTDGESVLMRDLLSGDEVRTPLKWTVRNVSFHGMTVEIFGAYAAVTGVHYGKGRGVKGSRSGLSLDDLENFRPLTADRPLQVSTMGATVYAR
ncbi:MAG: tetratricopeptide repeat protein [Planctomycetota bacterium]